jgi:hypothetical protein
MLEPHVIIALQEFYQRDFGVSETPPAPEDNTVIAVKYASHYLLFDFVPGLILPKLNLKAIGEAVSQLREDENYAVKMEEVEARFDKIFEDLKSAFGGYAPYAYAELLNGKPALFFLDEAEIDAWKPALGLD